jgi:hypothetical protein
MLTSDILGAAMSHNHLPRPLIILLFLLVGVTFFIGILRAFTPARARSGSTVTPSSTPQVTSGDTPAGSSSGTPSSTPTLAPSPTPDVTVYADTTGIIALAVLMVIVILVGVAWGARTPRGSDGSKK